MDAMISVNNSPESLTQALAERVRHHRLRLDFTQQGLADRSGVPLGTLKKFERTGALSLLAFIKLVTTLRMEGEIEMLLAKDPEFETLDQVLKQNEKDQKTPKRGRIK